MENKSKRLRRTSNDIEEGINKAAIQLIEENGFSNITVRGILERAKIDPPVFYNRYTDLNDFMDDFVKKYDYWFSEIANKSKREDVKLQYIDILNNLFKSLKENKMMQQLLRWELSNNNDITKRTAQLREYHTLPLTVKYKKIFENSSIDIDAISALIVGGIYYLVLHSGLSNFSGIDILSDEGKSKICSAIEYLGNMLFTELSPDSKIIAIAKKMKEKEVDFVTIEEYTGLTIDIIRQL